ERGQAVEPAGFDGANPSTVAARTDHGHERLGAEYQGPSSCPTGKNCQSGIVSERTPATKQKVPKVGPNFPLPAPARTAAPRGRSFPRRLGRPPAAGQRLALVGDEREQVLLRVGELLDALFHEGVLQLGHVYLAVDLRQDVGRR